MERELNTLHTWIQNCQKLASYIELQPLPVLSPSFSDIWIALNFQYKECGHWKWPTWMVTGLSWMNRILSLLTCLIWGFQIIHSLQASQMLQNCYKLPRETPSSSDVLSASAVKSLLSSYSKLELSMVTELSITSPFLLLNSKLMDSFGRHQCPNFANCMWYNLHQTHLL